MSEPTITCPGCGAEAEDFDGFGVLACPADHPCSYCTHPGHDLIDGRWICTLCGEDQGGDDE